MPRIRGAVAGCIVVLGAALALGGQSSIPTGLKFIPDGPFMMGDSLGEGFPDELPAHSVVVSAFYMGATEVTNDELLRVLTWALRNGRIEVSEASVRNVQGDARDLVNLREAQCRITWNGVSFGLKPEKAAGYPCVEVTWYGAVAYCNFLSEIEGFTPCYDLADWSCDWSADGYRLPTEAEWEKAARGGSEGLRFPWSDTDTIQHARANYLSTGEQLYDTSPTRGLHPDYDEGEIPYTSPVGSFAPNAYGIHDVAGNVWEWVWDSWETRYYFESPSRDPRGPEFGSYRVVRGGRWGYDASYSRVSGRRFGWPEGRKPIGFRVAMNAQP